MDPELEMILSMFQGTKMCVKILEKLRNYNDNLPQDKKLILPEKAVAFAFGIQFQGFDICFSISCNNPRIYCETLLFDSMDNFNRNTLYKYDYEDGEKIFDNFDELIKEIERVHDLLTCKIVEQPKQHWGDLEVDSSDSEDFNLPELEVENQDFSDSPESLESEILFVNSTLEKLKKDTHYHVKLSRNNRIIIQIPNFNIVLSCWIQSIFSICGKFKPLYRTCLLRNHKFCTLVSYPGKKDNLYLSYKVFDTCESFFNEINTVMNFFTLHKKCAKRVCNFGINCNDKTNCLYQHPHSNKPCKKGINCTMLGCLFTHNQKNPPLCKYNDNCYRTVCRFEHSKTNKKCTYGSNCKNGLCRFVH